MCGFCLLPVRLRARGDLVSFAQVTSPLVSLITRHCADVKFPLSSVFVSPYYSFVAS